MFFQTKNLNLNQITANGYFLNKHFKFQTNIYNRSHDLLLMSMNLSDIIVLNIEGCDICCIISGISKNEVINLMQNADLI